MASMNSEIIIKTELRPCMANGRKALFHRWCERSRAIDASSLIGGHPAGIIIYTVGIVELEHGIITEYNPTDIVFIDTKIEEYCFGAEHEILPY